VPIEQRSPQQATTVAAARAATTRLPAAPPLLALAPPPQQQQQNSSSQRQISPTAGDLLLDPARIEGVYRRLPRAPGGAPDLPPITLPDIKRVS
jgi:hypothetical protein